jgi:hypothetical protein
VPPRYKGQIQGYDVWEVDHLNQPTPLFPPQPETPVTKSPAEIRVATRLATIAHKGGTLEHTHKPEVYIENPILRGAVPDYKTTALALAAQLLDARDRLAQQVKINDLLAEEGNKNRATISEMYTDRYNIEGQVRALESHWSAFFWPKSIRTRLRQLGVTGNGKYQRL